MKLRAYGSTTYVRRLSIVQATFSESKPNRQVGGKQKGDDLYCAEVLCTKENTPTTYEIEPTNQRRVTQLDATGLLSSLCD